jgi:hypothetical protein
MTQIINPSPVLIAYLGNPEIQYTQACTSDTCCHASHDEGYDWIEVEDDSQISKCRSDVHGWGVSRLKAERALLKALSSEQEALLEGEPYRQEGWTVVRHGWDKGFRSTYATQAQAERAARIEAVRLYDWHMAPESWDVLSPQGDVVATFPTATPQEILLGLSSQDDDEGRHLFVERIAAEVAKAKLQPKLWKWDEKH